MEKFIVIIPKLGDSIHSLHQENGVYVETGAFMGNTAMGKEMTQTLRAIVQKKGTLFMVVESTCYYMMTSPIGEMIDLVVKVIMSGGQKGLEVHKFVRFIEETQFFTSMDSEDFEGLRDRVLTYYTVNKLSGKKEESK